MYFTPVVGLPKAKCDICRNEFSFRGGSTANLSKHLRAKHPATAADMPARKMASKQSDTGTTTSADTNGCNAEAVVEAQTSSATDVASVAVVTAPTCSTFGTSLSANGASATHKSKRQQGSLHSFIARPTSISRKKKLDNLLLKTIICDFQPFSLVEDEGFREFVAALDPSYTLPSRWVLTKDLLAIAYSKAVDEVKRVLTTAEALSLTTDSWTSISTENYIAVTAHYVTTDFEMDSCLLEIVKYGERHTIENLSGELHRVVTSWDIADKVVAIVTDNAANITGAVKQAGFTHLPCFAHTLNLVVQQGVRSIEPLKVKVKEIVEYFRRSTVAAEKLRFYQSQLLPNVEPLKLKNDVATRWNSTYMMCSRLCEVQEPLEAAIGVLHNPVNPLTADDWQALREICRILRPFDQVTTEMSAEKSVTVSKIIVLYQGLMAVCQKIQISLITQLAKDLIFSLIEGLKKRFGLSESYPMLARATFLDPRFKRNGFSTDATYNSVLKDITNKVTQLVTDQQTKQVRQQSSSNEANSDTCK